MKTNETKARYEFSVCDEDGMGEVVATAEYETYSDVLATVRDKHPGKTIRVRDNAMRHVTSA